MHIRISPQLNIALKGAEKVNLSVGLGISKF